MKWPVPVVVDADALFLVASLPSTVVAVTTGGEDGDGSNGLSGGGVGGGGRVLLTPNIAEWRRLRPAGGGPPPGLYYTECWLPHCPLIPTIT